MTALRDYVDEGPVGKRRLPVLASSAKDIDEDDDGDEADDDGDDADDFDVESFAGAGLDAE